MGDRVTALTEPELGCEACRALQMVCATHLAVRLSIRKSPILPPPTRNAGPRVVCEWVTPSLWQDLWTRRLSAVVRPQPHGILAEFAIGDVLVFVNSGVESRDRVSHRTRGSVARIVSAVTTDAPGVLPGFVVLSLRRPQVVSGEGQTEGEGTPPWQRRLARGAAILRASREPLYVYAMLPLG